MNCVELVALAMLQRLLVACSVSAITMGTCHLEAVTLSQENATAQITLRATVVTGVKRATLEIQCKHCVCM